MILDAQTDDRGPLARAGGFDVCIIGAGPAGITLARRLAAAGASVALMEAGGLELEADAQDLYAGDSVGQEYLALDTSRLRVFGGTSGHWGGMCRPLDALDFRPRPWVPMSGWPIGPEALAPHAAAVTEILELSYPVKCRWGDPTRVPNPDPAFDDPTGFPDIPLEQARPRFRRISFRYSPPVRFGEKYRAEIAAAPHVVCALHANLVELQLAGEDGATGEVVQVRRALFRAHPEDPGFAVEARLFALCAGGIENARLLLAACPARPEGLGNRHDLVGRCFADHPTFTVADVLYAGPTAPGIRFFAPTESFLTEEGLLNIGLRLYVDPLPPIPHFAGALERSLVCEADFLRALSTRVLGHPPDCARGGLGAWAEQHRHPPLPVGRIEIAAEQAPDPASRVRLGEERDAFGMPRVVLDWRLGALKAHTIRQASLALAVHLAETGTGRARLRDWLLHDGPQYPGPGTDDVGGPHHMGTTRMAADPRQGVVDAQARVHGVGNLYVGGSSVFPTGGHANPTYTIVGLALRLGDHLAAMLGMARG